MSRRSLLTVSRVVILYITFAVLLIPMVAGSLHGIYNPNEANNTLRIIFFLTGALLVALRETVKTILLEHHPPYHKKDGGLFLYPPSSTSKDRVVVA